MGRPAKTANPGIGGHPWPRVGRGDVEWDEPVDAGRQGQESGGRCGWADGVVPLHRLVREPALEHARIAQAVAYSHVVSAVETTNPSAVRSPTTRPPWRNASGIIVSASIVRTAPAAKA